MLITSVGNTPPETIRVNINGTIWSVVRPGIVLIDNSLNVILKPPGLLYRLPETKFEFDIVYIIEIWRSKFCHSLTLVDYLNGVFNEDA